MKKIVFFLRTQSDDDINTTTSDIDSQPATPLSQASDIYEEPSRPTYSKDGLFKVPRIRNDSATSQTEQDYIIAKRTRSKISLTETPIEAIESTFKAPDAPLDMYQFDPDDPYWTDFLTGLAMPMSKMGIVCQNCTVMIEKKHFCLIFSLASEMEKDEDADPDYSPALMDSQPGNCNTSNSITSVRSVFRAKQFTTTIHLIPDDREEFQHGNVPKKEVHDLWNEIMESCVNSDLSDYMDYGALIDTGINADDLNVTLETPVKQTEDSLAAPETNKGRPSSSKVVNASIASPAASNANISYFDPNAMSTPAKVIRTPERQQSQSQSFDSFNGTLLAPPSQPVSYSGTISNQQYAYQYPTGGTHSISSFGSSTPILIQTAMTLASNSNTLNQSIQSSLVKMSSEATTTSAIPSTVVTSFQIDDNSIEVERQIRSRPGHRAKLSRFKNAAYKELENLDPNAIQPKVKRKTQICIGKLYGI